MGNKSNKSTSPYDDLDEVYQSETEPVREWWVGARIIDPEWFKGRAGEWQKRNPAKHAERQREYRKGHKKAKKRVLSDNPKAVYSREYRARVKAAKLQPRVSGDGPSTP